MAYGLAFILLLLAPQLLGENPLMSLSSEATWGEIQDRK